MTNKATEEMLQELMFLTTKALKERVDSEEACAADFNAAISLLKHNAVTITPDQGKALDELEEALKKKRLSRKKRLEGLTDDDKTNVIEMKRMRE